MTARTLLIISGREGDALKAAAGRLGREPVAVLGLRSIPDDHQLPAGWEKLDVARFTDIERVREAFLDFLDRWPRQAISNRQSFDQLFRRRGGYSVWWTGPARGRHPDRGGFLRLKALWICDNAIRTLAPRRVLIYTDDGVFAKLVSSRCRGQIDWELLPGSAHPAREPWGGLLLWAVRSIARLPFLPLTYLIRAACLRLFNMLARTRAPQQTESAVVLVCETARDIKSDGEQISAWFWEDFRRAFADLQTGVVSRYRLVYRKAGWLFHPSWRVLTQLEGSLPADEGYPELAGWSRELREQIASIVRYSRMERTAAFRSSFRFAGADVAALYAPRLRYAVSRSIDWAHSVACAARSLRSSGRVSAMLVVKELYPSEMVTLAAARELGIATVGVQHGLISPAHLIYTLPKGYVDGAPIPDYFAVYGELAKETVSTYGSYPVGRVWITGGARFDHLVRTRPDKQAARLRLGLAPDAKVVLVTTQGYPWFPDVTRAVLTEVRDKPGVIACIKTHPLGKARIDTYDRIARELGVTNVRLFEDRFADLLAACDVLVSCSSTTILEAILAGRRTICANFSTDPDQYPFVADGGSLGARSPGEMATALAIALADEVESDAGTRERFLKRHAGPAAKGMAAATLARRIQELAGAADDRRPEQQTHEGNDAFCGAVSENQAGLTMLSDRGR